MQRLDRERHARGSRVGEECMQRLVHLPAGAGDVARALRQAADHQHETLRADGGRFLDGTAVVVKRGAAPRRVGGGKHAAAAQPGDGHAVRAHELSRALGPARLHDVAPGRDRGDAGPRAALDQLLERPCLHRHRIDRDQRAIARQVTHHAESPFVSNGRVGKIASRVEHARAKAWRDFCPHIKSWDAFAHLWRRAENVKRPSRVDAAGRQHGAHAPGRALGIAQQARRVGKPE